MPSSSSQAALEEGPEIASRTAYGIKFLSSKPTVNNNRDETSYMAGRSLKIYEFEELGRSPRKKKESKKKEEDATVEEIVPEKKAHPPREKQMRRRARPAAKRTAYSIGFNLLRESIREGDDSVKSLIHGKPLSTFLKPLNFLENLEANRLGRALLRARHDDDDDDTDDTKKPEKANFPGEWTDHVDQTMALFAMFSVDVGSVDLGGQPSAERPLEKPSLGRSGSVGSMRSSASTESAMSGESSVSFVSAASGMTSASRVSKRNGKNGKNSKRSRQEQLQTLTRKNTQDYLDLNHGYENFLQDLEKTLSAREEAIKKRHGKTKDDASNDDDSDNNNTREEGKKKKTQADANKNKNNISPATTAATTPLGGGGSKSRKNSSVALSPRQQTSALLKKAEAASVASRRSVAVLARTLETIRRNADEGNEDLKATLSELRQHRGRQLQLKFDNLLPRGQIADDVVVTYKDKAPPKELSSARETDAGSLDGSSQELGNTSGPGRAVFRDIRVELLAMRQRVQVKERSRMRETIGLHQWLKPVLKKVASDARKYGRLQPAILRLLGAIHRCIAAEEVVTRPFFFIMLRYALQGDDWKLKITEKILPIAAEGIGISHEDFVDWLRQNNIAVNASFLRGSNRRGGRSKKGRNNAANRLASRARPSALGALDEDA